MALQRAVYRSRDAEHTVLFALDGVFSDGRLQPAAHQESLPTR
jgi:hypothetical protein